MADFDFDAQVEASNARSKTGCLAAAIVSSLAVVACVVFAILWTFANTRKNASEVDRDYFEILVSNYESIGILAYEIQWSSRSLDAFTGPNSFQYTRPALNNLKSEHRLIESLIVLKRQEFIAKHNTDSAAWKSEFSKRYPEREVIFEDVKIFASNRADRDIHAMHERLVAIKLLDVRNSPIDQIADMKRTDLFNTTSKQNIANLRADMRSLASVQSLRSKVIGKR